MNTLRALPCLGATLTVLGLAHPWRPDSETSLAVGAGLLGWLLLPLVCSALFHRHCRTPRTTTLLTIWLVCLSAVWGLGAVAAFASPEADLNLGLLFIPPLEWLALFSLFVFWSLERAHRHHS